MTQDGMPRAYLRMDPNIDQHPDPLGMVLLLCAGARQTERGRFRDLAVVSRAVGRARTKQMVERGDLVQIEDGRWYVAGWDVWQEGDWTVAERMRRMRAKRANKRNPTVTQPSPGSMDVTTDATSRDSSVSRSPGDGDDISPPPAMLGRRVNGTNPRALGTNPRATGESPRQQREAEKRGGAQSLATILARAAAAGKA